MKTRAPRPWEKKRVAKDTITGSAYSALSDEKLRAIDQWLDEHADVTEVACGRRSYVPRERMSPDGAATLEEAKAYSEALAAANALLEAVRSAPEVPDPRKVIEAAAEQLVRQTERRVRAERDRKAKNLDGMLPVGGPTQKSVVRDEKGHISEVIEKTTSGVVVKRVVRDGTGRIEGVVEQEYERTRARRA
jgi:hypothetical protein